MITVYYDGTCGLCAKEINHYREIAPAGVFVWQDITTSAESLNKLGISLAQGLKRLHATDGKGELHVGVGAFILIWQQLPRWRMLARVVAIPGVRYLVGRVYCAFADWKFKRASHCRLVGRG